MPTVTFRLSDAELEALRQDARVQGVSVSEVVRRGLGFARSGLALEGRVDDLEARVARLEQMAGL